MSYYGCTATHPEFTCLTAFYVGPKRFRKEANWCPTCREKLKCPSS